MKKNDWIGLGVSLVIHALLLWGFSFMTLKAAEKEVPGFIEVDFGDWSEGRPVKRAVETVEQKNVQPQPVPQQEPAPAPQVTPPNDVNPVKLPDPPKEVQDQEQISVPEKKPVAPREKEVKADEKPTPKPLSEPVKPLGGGQTGGETGAEEGEDGAGTTDRKRAPFDIEGLNRIPVATALPRYDAQVNAVIAVRITVDPNGRIVGSIPLRKGNPQLEQAVMDALRRWRFNPLPPNAPKENQSGVVTFRFVLE